MIPQLRPCKTSHCVKSVCIRSFSGLVTAGKYGPEKLRITDTFHAVSTIEFSCENS